MTSMLATSPWRYFRVVTLRFSSPAVTALRAVARWRFARAVPVRASTTRRLMRRRVLTMELEACRAASRDRSISRSVRPPR